MAAALHSRVFALVVLLAVATLGLVLICLGFGPGTGPSAWPTWSGNYLAPDFSAREWSIITDIRLPRVALGFLVGASLALAGLLLQTLMANPLADPYLIGVSGGAALCAVLAQEFGVRRPLSITLIAFVGGIVTMVVVMHLARFGGRLHRGTLILAGVVVNAFLASTITFILFWRQSEQSRLLAWLMGSLATPHETGVVALAGSTVIVAIGVWICAHPLNLLAMGDLAAHHLGLRVERAKWLTLIAASFLTAVAVALAGMIGFVGMFVPHAARILCGADHRILIPTTVILGGNLLVGTDSFARCAFPGGELPVGVLTAFLGAPAFLFLLIRNDKVVRV